MKSTILQGDVRATLKTLPDDSVHCVVTSPPYWALRSYLPKDSPLKPLEIGSEPTPEAFIAVMVEVFREVRRVLHPSGTCWVNIGDSYCSTAPGTEGDKLNRRGILSGISDECSTARVKQRPETPPGLKPKDLCLIPERLALSLQADGWWVRSRIAWCKKCLSGGTVLYARTQKGDMPSTLKDLARLDPKTVKLWDGSKWTRVVGWSKTPRTNNGELEIILRSGETIGCTGNHRWPTTQGEKFAVDLRPGDVLQQSRLPEPEQPDNPALLGDDEIGWLAGFYLAEGCATDKGIVFAMNTDESAFASRIETAASAFGGSATFRTRKGHSACCTVYSLPLRAVLQEYISGSSCYNKHLSNACWRRSNAFLIALLRGYLAGDGYARPDTDEWRLGFCKNDALASDLRVLCARLGVSLRLKRSTAPCNGKLFPMWRGSIRFGNDRLKPDSEIVAIRPGRARQYYDIEVADSPNLFCLGSGVVSHNSPMPESVTDRPTSAWEHIWLLSKASKYFYDAEAVKEPSQDMANRVIPQGWKEENGTWKSGNLTEGKQAGLRDKAHFEGCPDSGRNLRNFWILGPEPYSGPHFATFPSEIPKRCILAGTSARGCCPKCLAPWERMVERGAALKSDPSELDRYGNGTHGVHRKLGSAYQKQMNENPTRTTGWRPCCECKPGTDEKSEWAQWGDRGGCWPIPIPCTVLDPFGGSGTTAAVAIELGRRAILCELDPACISQIERRTDVTPGLALA